MRNLLQFAKSLRGCTMLPCFCIARLTHVLPCRFRAASLLVAWCHGWVGVIFMRSSSFDYPRITLQPLRQIFTELSFLFLMAQRPTKYNEDEDEDKNEEEHHDDDDYCFGCLGY